MRARVVTTVLTFAIMTACAGVNSQTHTYATLAEAREAGAIASGWIPEGLPAGTHDLRAAHVPGTAERWGIINFPQSESEALRALLQAQEVPLQGQRVDMPARIEWWPAMLRGDLDGERIGATGLHGYRATSGDLMFAVNWNQGRAYYWVAR